MRDVLAELRGGLVVSCQPVTGGPMDRPEIVAAMAAAAIAGGAHGVRVEGLANLQAARAVTKAPIIALIKRDLPDSPVRITPFASDVQDLAAAGADVLVAGSAVFRGGSVSDPAPYGANIRAIKAACAA